MSRSASSSATPSSSVYITDNLSGRSDDTATPLLIIMTSLGAVLYVALVWRRVPSQASPRAAGGLLQPDRPTHRGLLLANRIGFVGLVVVHGLVAAGVIGESIADVFEKYPSSFSPVRFTFVMWWVVHVALFLFIVAGRAGIAKIGRLFVVACALHIAWIIGFSQGWIVASFVAIVLLLITLLFIHARIGVDHTGLSLRDRVCFTWPFALYLAWVFVAVVANAFLLDSFVRDADDSDEAATLVLYLLAPVALVASFVRGLWTFPLMVGWTAVGIAARSESDTVQFAAVVATTLCGLFGVLAYQCGVFYHIRNTK